MSLLSAVRKIPRPSAKAAWLYLGGFACLALTALMNRHAGVSQGATEEGRQLLGWAAIVIDIVGIVVFGSVAGNLLAQGKKILGSAVLLVTLGCALFSITSIMSFVASEWLSVAETRRAAIEANKNRQAADIQASKERREAQERLAQSGLGMMQGQLKEAGKKEKRILSEKFAKGTAEMIDALGKEQATTKPAEAGKEIAQLPDGGAVVANWLLGAPEKTWQVTRIAAVAVLLIVLKLFAFPLGGYYWGQRKQSVAEAATTIDVTPTPLMEAAPAPILLAEPPKPLQLAKPIEVKPAAAPAPEPMAAEWQTILEELDYFAASRKGPLRAPLKREVLGYHWLAWLQANGRTGEHTADAVADLYNEFCSSAHREQGNSINVAKGELREAGRKVKKDSILVRDSKSPTLWHINVIPANRVRETLIKRNILRPSPVVAEAPSKAEKAVAPPPKKEEAASETVVPFVPSAVPASLVKAAPANDDVPVTRTPVRGLAELQARLVPDLDGLRRLERVNKAAWQAKQWVAHRKQQNRFSRARAA